MRTGTRAVRGLVQARVRARCGIGIDAGDRRAPSAVERATKGRPRRAHRGPDRRAHRRADLRADTRPQSGRAGLDLALPRPPVLDRDLRQSVWA